jgi:hypothetical protein
MRLQETTPNQLRPRKTLLEMPVRKNVTLEFQPFLRFWLVLRPTPRGIIHTLVSTLLEILAP